MSRKSQDKTKNTSTEKATGFVKKKKQTSDDMKNCVLTINIKMRSGQFHVYYKAHIKWGDGSKAAERIVTTGGVEWTHFSLKCQLHVMPHGEHILLIQSVTVTSLASFFVWITYNRMNCGTETQELLQRGSLTHQWQEPFHCGLSGLEC